MQEPHALLVEHCDPALLRRPDRKAKTT